MSDTEADGDLALDGVFPEEERPPSPEPTVAVYDRVVLPSSRKSTSPAADWTQLKIHLVGTHPLWAHHLWNAARSFATYLDSHPSLNAGKSVLELGAGGGLPSLVCALNGAAKVVITDYPDAALVQNMQLNVDENVPVELAERVSVQGYLWGHPTQPLLSVLPPSNPKFDLIILSDLLFNHSQHDALLTTCEAALTSAPKGGPADTDDAGGPCVLVFYTHHRPHLAHRDMEFFEKARARGWACEEVVIERFPVMFPEDSGAEEVRATVHGWVLKRVH